MTQEGKLPQLFAGQRKDTAPGGKMSNYRKVLTVLLAVSMILQHLFFLQEAAKKKMQLTHLWKILKQKDI